MFCSQTTKRYIAIFTAILLGVTVKCMGTICSVSKRLQWFSSFVHYLGLYLNVAGANRQGWRKIYYYYLKNKQTNQAILDSNSYCTYKPYCCNQLQRYLSHCTFIGFQVKWPFHVPVISPPPLVKVVSNTRPCSKLPGVTTFTGGGGGDKCVTSSDLKEKGRFSSVSEYFYRRLYYVFRLLKLPCILKEIVLKFFINLFFHFTSHYITISLINKLLIVHALTNTRLITNSKYKS